MKRKKYVRTLVPVYITVFAACLVLTVFYSRAVTTAAESAGLKVSRCIVIDAGHGGVDGGATSCSGVLESTINLEISLRLDDLLRLLGYKTSMIRTTDISVYTQGDTIAAKKISDLKQRVKHVNETENALLLSIHQNYFTNEKYSGAQVFYAPTSGSEQLAKQLQKAFVISLNPGSTRQAKKAEGVYLMNQVDCTAVLVECGFLSNMQEDTKLRSADYQKKLCCVIAASVSMYLDRSGID